MSYEPSGDLTTDERQASDTETWDTQTEWEAYQSASNVEIVNGAVELAEITIPDSVVHRWPYDEGSGDALRDSEGDADGTRVGPVWVSGDYIGGYALDGDGIDDYAEFTTLGNFGSQMDTDFAIIYTIESTDTSSDSIVMTSRTDGSDQGIIASLNSDFWGVTKGVIFGVRTVSGRGDTVISTNNDIIDDNKNRIVINKVTNDPANWEVWINASEVSTTVNNSNDLSNADNLEHPVATHGLSGGNGSYLNGVVDNPMVANESLSDSEITDDYNRQPWS